LQSDSAALISAKDETIATLRDQLEAERQAHAEARRLLMAALERIPPQLEATSEARESHQTADEQQGRGRQAPPRYGRVSGERTEAVVEESVRKMSEKALGMLKHMRKQIFGHPAPYVVVRGAAVSIGVDPGGSECDVLGDELLQAGYVRTYPSPSLTAHGLYRMTDRGIAAAQEG
jgi:hypothetical protein